mmetsp:Transcript_7926/g.4184  ORF Transcript_7926/g.4184 Transcript_7926/m.4184 type:complete len:83 (+) Transcript_7926:29-277(+)
MPPLPKFLILITIAIDLLCIGSLTVGILDAVYLDATNAEIGLFIVGGLLALPGVYLSVQLIRAWRAKTPRSRMEVLGSLPKW